MRLSKIITRTGDQGTTGLADGSRRSKCDLRVVAIGAVDELNSQIGLLLCEVINEDIRLQLLQTQHELFNLGGELSLPEHRFINEKNIERLENLANQFNETLPPLKEFILPGGSLASSLAQVTRAICRRAERDLVALNKEENLSPLVLQYINRLSDYLFILARKLNALNGQPDVLWKKELA